VAGMSGTLDSSSSYIQRDLRTYKGTGLIRTFAHLLKPHAVLGPTQHPLQWVAAALVPGGKRPRHGTCSSPPSAAEVGNAWDCVSAPEWVFMAWCL